MANKKKPEHLKLTEKLQVQLTKTEYQLVETAALEGETLSACARRIILDCLAQRTVAPSRISTEEQTAAAELEAMGGIDKIFNAARTTPAKTGVPAPGRRK